MYVETTVAIVIYPNSLDNWNTDPPFENDPLGTTDAYIVAATTEYETGFDDDYTLLTNRLIEVGNVYNKVDFMQKTLTDSTDRNISEGIGGLAKLKDFQFKLVNHDDIDVSNLYSRKIEVRLYEGSELLLGSSNYTVYFKGIIFKAVVSNNIEIKLYAQGLIANNNPRIKGTPYINPDGENATSVIVIGDTETSKIRLDKKRGPAGIQLGFDSSAYNLKKVYIKDKEVTEFYEVTDDYTVDGGFVNFSSAKFATLAANVADNNVHDTIYVNDGIDFVFLIEPANYQSWIVLVNPTYPKYKYRMRRISTFSANGKTHGLYRSCPAFAYQELWGEYVNFPSTSMFATSSASTYTESNMLGGTLTSWYMKNEEIIKMPRLTTLWDSDDAIQKLELVTFGEKFIREKRECTILPVEKKDLVVIKIDDEKMLVLYANDTYTSAERECKVVRGYLDTEVASHTSGTPITVLGSEETQRPKIRIKKSVEDVYRTDSINNTSTYGDSGINWRIYKHYSQTKAVMFLDLRLPDIAGEYRSAFIKSKMAWVVDDQIDKQTTLAVSLAMTEHENWHEMADNNLEKKIYSRQMVGYNEKNFGRMGIKQAISMHDTTYTNDVSGTLDDSFGAPYLMLGQNTYNATSGKQEYVTHRYSKHVLRGGWNSSLTGNDLSNYFKQWSTWSGHTFKITDYQELRKMHFALVANFYNCYTNRTYNIFIKYLRLYVKLRVPIADNEWYGEMRSLTTGNTQGELIDSFSLGANGSLYVTDDFKYVFAESDTIPFIIFELSPTGELSELQRVTTPDYNDIRYGELVLIDKDKVAKISVHTTDYKWVETVDVEDENFPNMDTEIKNSVNVEKVLVGGTVFDIGNYIACYESSTLRIYKKSEVAEGNPVNILKTLLTSYAKHDSALIDDDGTVASSFHRVRLSRKREKCTIIIEREINANLLIDKVCKNFGLVLYENNIGLMALADLYPPSENQVFTTLTDADLQLNFKTGKPEIKETHIDIRYLITNLDVRYKPFGDVFQEEIVNNDLPEELNDRLVQAKTYTENETEIAFNNSSTNDKKTALECALIKMQYHYKPTRILSIKTKIDWAVMDICSWLNITSDFIESAGMIYLLISKKDVLPIKQKRPYSEVELFEYNWDEISKYIQEVYEEDINDTFQEVLDTTDQIQEEE